MAKNDLIKTSFNLCSFQGCFTPIYIPIKIICRLSCISNTQNIFWCHIGIWVKNFICNEVLHLTLGRDFNIIGFHAKNIDIHYQKWKNLSTFKRLIHSCVLTLGLLWERNNITQHSTLRDSYIKRKKTFNETFNPGWIGFAA